MPLIFNISQMHVFYLDVLLLEQKHLMKFLPQGLQSFLNFHVTMNFSGQVNGSKEKMAMIKFPFLIFY